MLLSTRARLIPDPPTPKGETVHVVEHIDKKGTVHRHVHHHHHAHPDKGKKHNNGHGG